MGKHLFIIALSCLCFSCTKEESVITRKTVSNFEIQDCYTTSNGNKYLVYEQDNNLGTFKISEAQLDSIKSLQLFKIDVIEQNGKGSAISISTNNSDSTNKRLYCVEANDIEDYKRKSKGSYTLLESDGIIPVITPNQEISQMLRVESFKFYYYKNWDGKFYFDHIEENEIDQSSSE